MNYLPQMSKRLFSTIRLLGLCLSSALAKLLILWQIRLKWSFSSATLGGLLEPLRLSLLIIFFFTNTPVLANPVIDQSMEGGYGIFLVSRIQNMAQTFTVGIDGLLVALDIKVGHYSYAPSTPLQIDIRPTSGGMPLEDDNSYLAFWSFNPYGVTVTGDWLHLVVSNPFPVHIGDVFAIVLRSNDTGESTGYGWWAEYKPVLDGLGPYPGGVFVARNANVGGTWGDYGQTYDANFRTYVDSAAPAPGKIEVSPTFHDFGNVQWGQTSTAMFTISNIGGRQLALSAISLSNAQEVFSITSAPSPLPYILEPGKFITVEVTFNPKTILPYSGSVLKIASNDADKPLIEIPLSGTGVLADTPSEQVTTVVNYILKAIANGELTGVGEGESAAHKVQALINMIQSAGDLLAGGQTALGCQQMADLYLKVDSVSPPPDFVTGPATAGLASAIQGMRTYYGCQ